MELSRLLRRGLLVAGVAAAGWLLTALFAANASAETAPGTTHSGQSQSGGGLLGGLLGGVTNAVTGLTTTVADVTGAVLNTAADATSSLLAPSPPQAQDPVLELPSLLPSHGSSSGDATTERAEPAPRAEAVPPAPVVVPAPVPVVPEPAPVVAPVAPAPAPAPQAVTTAPAGAATEQAGHGSTPEPVKVPASPAGPATTAAPSHDNSGGARGTHGVLSAAAPKYLLHCLISCNGHKR